MELLLGIKRAYVIKLHGFLDSNTRVDVYFRPIL
jgi:hypothetical protein